MVEAGEGVVSRPDTEQGSREVWVEASWIARVFRQGASECFVEEPLPDDAHLIDVQLEPTLHQVRLVFSSAQWTGHATLLPVFHSGSRPPIESGGPPMGVREGETLASRR